MILMLLIIVATDVRSLLYFIIMPVFFFVLYRILFTVTNLKLFIRKSMPFAILLFFFSFIVSYIRFGYYSLPETELTSIALDSMDRWKFEFQYFNSILKYFSGFLGVFRNSLSILDINLPDYMRFIPSVPQLNAMIQAQVLDVTDLENAYHMPATIFYDFMMCWDMFAPVAAFFTYWYFIKVFDIFQKTSFRIILFSSIVGWHFYMLMRGAVDTCSSAMAYPFILGILIYYLVIKFSLIKENQEIS